jgi:diguanylate cyclase (GGDEF)-like protein
MIQAVEAAERLRQKVEAAEVALENVALRFTLSIGVSTLTESASSDVDALLNQADQALYEGKRAGRNRVCVFGEGAAEREA